MHIDTLWTELAAQLGIPRLEPDPQGACAVVFDGDLHVDLYYAESAQVLGLAAEVAPFDDDRRHEQARVFLEANLDPESMGDHFFAFSRQSRCVTLCRALEVEALDMPRLMEELGRLVTACREWRERVAQHRFSMA